MNAGEEIIAKLPNNIWFYKCHIKELVGDYKYKVQFESNKTFMVYREDLIQMCLKNDYSFEVKKIFFLN